MKKTLVACALLACTTVAFAVPTPIFQDDFESGLTKWTQGSSALTWATDQAKSPTHSAKADLSADRMYASLGQEVTSPEITVWIYDDTMTRTYAQLLAYSGAGYNQGSLEQLLAIGKYNQVTMPGETYKGTKYQARFALGTGNGWFNLDGTGSPNRSTGWHKFTIKVLQNQSTVEFYVDSILSRTITGLTPRTYDSITLGFGTASSTSNGNTWYDDVVVTPEPATLAVLALGSLFLRRRR